MKSNQQTWSIKYLEALLHHDLVIKTSIFLDCNFKEQLLANPPTAILSEWKLNQMQDPTLCSPLTQASCIKPTPSISTTCLSLPVKDADFLQFREISHILWRRDASFIARSADDVLFQVLHPNSELCNFTYIKLLMKSEKVRYWMDQQRCSLVMDCSTKWWWRL